MLLNALSAVKLDVVKTVPRKKSSITTIKSIKSIAKLCLARVNYHMSMISLSEAQKQAVEKDLQPPTDYNGCMHKACRQVLSDFLSSATEAYDSLKCSDIARVEDLSYADGNEPCKIDVWGKVDKKLFVFVHGGYWQEGNRKLACSPAFAAVPAEFAYASIGYNYSTKERPLSLTVQQVVNSVRYLIEKYPNLEKIVIGGHSAGAQLAFKTCSFVKSPKIVGLVLLAGVYDLKELVRCEIGQGAGLTESEAEKNSCNADELSEASMKILILIGDEESPRLREQNKKLYEELGEKNHDVRYKELEGVNHFTLVTDLKSNASEERNMLEKFLKDI
ncbi:hypothetical protein WR25_16856 [Diploscapter pachys]|uniref:BD-FAE-like domain-containing protein n=1 Tax=Diploscapter pachys TaxID=2018661 RepID=A0A2A2LDX9_9BILA|nr:hypothetical protein WR25_16856 [Diploscapter pachys]